MLDKQKYIGKNYNKKNDYELRNYNSFVTATVKNVDSSDGFTTLAGYIGVMGKP